MTKKLFAIVIVTSAMLVAWAETWTDPETGYTWTYTVSSGEVSLGGGTISSCAVPTSTTGAITIPSSLNGFPVTSVGAAAFYGCCGLTNVTIPTSVTNIGDSAFCDCYGLVNTTIAGAIVNIGWRAFYGCTNLTSMIIGNGLNSIGDEAFRDCINLESVILPDSVTSIGACAFRGCDGLADADGFVVVKNVLHDYVGDATIITIPDSVTDIGESAFFNCTNLTSVTIPNSVTSIWGYAFSVCRGLKSVTVPNSVNAIGRSAFSGCRGLTSVTIPDSVTSIGACAFRGCDGLADADGFVVVKNVLHDYVGDNTNITIPDSVTSIGERAFYNCTNLTSVTIPDNVTSIENYAFGDCRGLTSVTIPNSVTSIWGDAFAYCRGLTSVTMPSSRYSVPWVFPDAYTNIKSVTIPSGSDRVVANAFMGCTSLTSVTIPDSVTSIGVEAFRSCTNLTNVTLPDSVTRILTSAFLNCSGLTSVTIPDSVSIIYNKVFSGCSGLTSVSIPNSVTSIWDSAFSDCEGLTSVTIPDSVTSIGYGAFGGCINLMTVFYSVSDTEERVRALVSGTGCDVSGVVFSVVEDASFKVTFNANGGNVTEASRKVSEGETVGNLPTPTRKGYKFLGWYTAQSGGTKATAETVVKKDMELFALWVAAWTVTLNANGGQFGSQGAACPTSTETVMVQKGKAIGSLGENALPIPTREGYTFAGWWTKKSGGVKITTKTKVTKDVTYYAHWTVKKFKVAATVNTKSGGVVSGAGKKTYGSKTTLKAASKKGYVFVKWINVNDEDAPWPSALKCRQPSVTFTMGAGNVSVKAVFAKSSADPAPVLSVSPDDVWYVEDDPGREISVAADSLSYPAVTLSGAPAGIGLVRVPDTDARYVLKVTDAAKMKPGVYTAKVTAKNRAGKSASKSVKIVTPNSSGAVNAGLVAGIEPSTLKPYTFEGGMKMKKTLADLGVEVFQTNGWKLVSVTGLPTGLSWNGTAIVGTASKMGVFTVTFTMKKTVKDAKTKKTKTYTSTATATFAVDTLLPGEVVGTYNGFANTNVADPGDNGDKGDCGDSGDEGDDDGEVENVIYTPIMDGWASSAKVTVTTAGKITVNVGGVAITGNGFDSVSNGVYAVTLKKTQKITKGSLKGKSKVWEAYIEIDTSAAWCGRQVSGWFYTYITGLPSMTAPAYISAQRNAFGGDADAKAMATAVAGTWKFALKSVKGEEWAYGLASGGKALSVVVKQNGATTLAGKIGSVKVSGAGTLEVGETAATARFFSGKFAIEVVYAIEDGMVVSASGRVWKK